MRVYVGFDDTDTLDADRGTGKLARWFEKALPDGCRLWGVVRQQLKRDLHTRNWRQDPYGKGSGRLDY